MLSRSKTCASATAPSERWTGVSLDINEGEIFGLLAPNGAGKTSTLRNNRALLLSFALPVVVLYALFASPAFKRAELLNLTLIADTLM